MKSLIVFTVLIWNCGFSQTEVNDSSDIIAFNESIAQSIIDGNRTLNVDYYITKEELQLLLKGAPDSFIQPELEAYEENLEQFSKNYSDNFKRLNLGLSNCSDINWSDCSIDSSEYSFEIMRPNEKDTKINWPESKSYEAENEQIVIFKGVIFVSEGEKRYGISVQTIYCSGKLKFYDRWARAPRIGRLE